MPVKLSTTVANIRTIPNENNQILVKEFYEFMKSSGTSDKYQNNNLKTIISFGKFLEPLIIFSNITKRDQIIAFLDTKIKNSRVDPDKRWITTWNDYLGRIKYFFRWLHNTRNSSGLRSANRYNEDVYIPITEWETPLYIIQGRVDLLIKENNLIKIIDFKTQSRASNENYLQNGYYEQLYIYAYVLREKYGINLKDYIFIGIESLKETRH